MSEILPHDEHTLIDRHRRLSMKVRQLSEAANPRLLAVREAAIYSVTIKDNQARGKTYQQPDDRMYLIAQYMLGIDLSYLAIVDGLYPQAANLQKQQIETLARLEEITADTHREGKPPNVNQKSLPGLGRAYGKLNDAAHPSKREVIEALNHFSSGNVAGPSSDPRFIQEYCEPLLDNHCVCLMHLWRQMANLFELKFDIRNTAEEERVLEAAIKSLIKMGAITPVKP